MNARTERTAQAAGLLRALLTVVAVAGVLALTGGGQPEPTPAAAATALSPKFGVHGSIPAGSGDPDVTPSLQELGAGWVRLNYDMDGILPDFARFLDAGVNIVITFQNRDPQNVADPGDLITFPQGGFPYVDRTAYQNRIRDALTPLLPYLSSGRQVYAQFENEVGPFNTYWHAGLNAYLPQLSAGYEAVHALSPSIPVVTYGIASGVMELIVYDPANAGDQIQWLTTLFTTGQYDVVDLHFYHCPSSIPAKVQAVLSLMPAAKPWISTENGGPDTRCLSTPDFSEEIEAEQVPVRLQSCADSGGSVCLWFSFFDMVNTSPPFDTLGLLERPSVPGGEPRKKPAYWAFQAYVADSDGDGIPNDTDTDDDNDGAVDGADLAECGGDPLSTARRPERIDPPFAGVDDDGDGQIDESLPSGASAFDCDGDGYAGTAEAHVFPTAQGDQDPCGTDAWPADLTDAGGFSANKVNISDLASYVGAPRYLNTNVGTNPGDVRYDVVPGSTFGNHINIVDLQSVAFVTAPMLGGARMFNGPACPW